MASFNESQTPAVQLKSPLGNVASKDRRIEVVVDVLNPMPGVVMLIFPAVENVCKDSPAGSEVMLYHNHDLEDVAGKFTLFTSSGLVELSTGILYIGTTCSPQNRLSEVKKMREGITQKGRYLRRPQYRHRKVEISLHIPIRQDECERRTLCNRHIRHIMHKQKVPLINI